MPKLRARVASFDTYRDDVLHVGLDQGRLSCSRVATLFIA